MTTEEIIKECIKLNHAWAYDERTLRAIINIANVDGDGTKLVTIIGKGTYRIPISEIICLGINAAEVPEKYKLLKI